MRTVLTKREAFTSKAGTDFVSYKGVAASGDTVQILVTTEQESEYGLSADLVEENESIENFFGNAKNVVDISFNQRGRVDSVKVE